MKVVHLSHTDSGAGAGGAAYRIHRSLRALAVDSSMLVSQKRTFDPMVEEVSGAVLGRFGVRCVEYLEAKNGQMLARDESVFFSVARFSCYKPASSASIHEADVVALYWINGAFISPEGLGVIDKPLVWRLSDVWPFTGGCHYPGACDGFERACGFCPQLRRPALNDASHHLLRRKLDAWHALDLTVVAPSRWMAELARRSALFSERRIEVVPTGVDLERYCPEDRLAARVRLGLPQDRLLILFGAMNPGDDVRKGYRELRLALEVVACSPLASHVLAVVFGSDDYLEGDLPVPTVSLGRLQGDEALAVAYNCADVVVVPSLEDNLPNVALEAIACGVPVLAFDVCGMPEIVTDGWNGRLISRSEPEALGRALVEMLSDSSGLKAMRSCARAHAEANFSLSGQAQSYMRVYEDVVTNHRQHARSR